MWQLHKSVIYFGFGLVPGTKWLTALKQMTGIQYQSYLLIEQFVIVVFLILSKDIVNSFLDMVISEFQGLKP